MEGQHYALLEVDVTRTRQFIEDHKAQTGEALSFTGYLAFCLARAVDEDKSVQAYLKGRKHLVVFDDVDVFLPVERELGGTPAAIPYIIRRANHKSFLEIHREIRDFQSQPVPPGRGAALGVPGHDVSPLAAASAVRPTHSRRQSPRPRPRCDGSGHGRRDSARHGWSRRRRLGPGAGRAITPPDRGWHRSQARRYRGALEPRDLLNLTIAFDHDVVDGAPAARFVRRLVDLIESGYGLEETYDAPVSAAGPG